MAKTTANDAITTEAAPLVDEGATVVELETMLQKAWVVPAQVVGTFKAVLPVEQAALLNWVTASCEPVQVIPFKLMKLVLDELKTFWTQLLMFKPRRKNLVAVRVPAVQPFPLYEFNKPKLELAAVTAVGRAPMAAFTMR